MSVQACLIKGFGYKFNFDDLLFSHLDDEDKEEEFIDVIGMYVSYYRLRDKESSQESFLGIITDGMNGEYKYVMFITEASYIMNTHGDHYWRHTYRMDEYIKNYAKQKIETLLGRTLGEPEEHTFEHYS